MANEQHSGYVTQSELLLMDAFIELYKTTPLEKITITKLAQRAHVSRGTFYLYYEDIYAILHRIEDNIIKGLELRIKNVVPHSEARTQKEYYCSLYILLLEHIKSNREYFKALMFGSYSSHFIRKYEKFIENNFKLTLKGLLPDEIIPYCGVFYSSANVAACKYWLETDCELPSYQVATFVYQTLFMGITNSAF